MTDKDFFLMSSLIMAAPHAEKSGMFIAIAFLVLSFFLKDKS